MSDTLVIQATRLRNVKYWLIGLGIALLLLVVITGKTWSNGIALWQHATKPKLTDLVHGCWWWAALLNGLLCFPLAATAHWWFGLADFKNSKSIEDGTPKRASQSFKLALIGIVALAFFLRAPRLGLSLYNDESYAFRSHIAGAFADAPPGPVADAALPKFKPQSWLGTLYQSQRGNNSMLFSLLARCSYDAWRGITGSAPGTIHESALRLPVLVASLLGIVTLAALGRRMSGERLGLILATLAALHPWHVRYSVEARCYGLLFLLLPLLAYCLERAWHSSHWRWWLAFGGVQFLILNCFFGCVFMVALLNGLVLTANLIRWWRDRQPQALLRCIRLCAVGLLSGMVYLQTTLPHYLQNQRFLAQSDVLRGSFDTRWFADLGSLLLAGIPAFEMDAANAANLNAERYLHQQPLAFYLVLSLLSVACGVGLWRVWKERHLLCTSYLLASLGGLLCTVAVFMAKSLVLLTWYGIFVLPAVLILLALGTDWLFKKHRSLGFVIFVILLAWLPASVNFGQHSREDLRGPIERTHGLPYPALLSQSSNLRMGCFWSNSPIYDPRIVPLWKLEELQAMIKDAQQSHHALWIENGFSASAKQQQPELYALVNDPKVFQPIATFPGLDYEMSTHYLFRLIDGK